MFKLPARLFFAFFSNIIALGVAVYFVKGFIIAPNFSVDPRPFLTVAAIFAFLQVLVRPIVKLFLGPLIIITFGLAIIAINMGMLWLLDFLSLHITIQGLTSLFLATIVIGAVNVGIAFVAKRVYK